MYLMMWYGAGVAKMERSGILNIWFLERVEERICMILYESSNE